jgi:hypothetical protein
MSYMMWTKQSISEIINQQIEQENIRGGFILAQDITDTMVEQVQEIWAETSYDAVRRDAEIKKLFAKFVSSLTENGTKSTVSVPKDYGKST